MKHQTQSSPINTPECFNPINMLAFISQNSIKKAIVLTFALILMSVSLVAETTYYINIDNAPDSIAVGEMIAFIDGIPWDSADLEWYDNYLGGVGGKYRSNSPLPSGSTTQHVTIKCEARRNYMLNGPWGYSEQTFTGTSSTFLPPMHIPTGLTEPVNPPYPK